MSRTQAVAQAIAPVVPVPVVWTLLGYPFEAGPMIVGLICCFAVRFYTAQTSGPHRWAVDIPVSTLALMFTAGVIIRLRPEPFWAMVYGTGVGAMGATIITAALAWVKRSSALFGAAPEEPKP